jgi:Spy/CpxP family protein refolding chaperone
MRSLSKVKLFFLVAAVLAVPLAFAQSSAPAPDQPAKKDAPAMHQHKQWQMADRGHQGPGDAEWGRWQAWGMHQRQHRPEFILVGLVNQPEVRKRLGITDEQAEKIRTQTSEFRKTEIRNRAEVEVKHVELKDLLAAEKPDRGAIDTKLQEISALRLAGEKAAMGYRLDMREALTPEQREKLKQMRDNFGHGGPGHQGPHGPQAVPHPPDSQG